MAERSADKPKRCRSANLSADEKALLTNLCAKYREVIEIKKTDSASVRLKEGTWKRMAEEFQTRSLDAIPRDWMQLRQAYENMKKRSKRALLHQSMECQWEADILATNSFADVPVTSHDSMPSEPDMTDVVSTTPLYSPCDILPGDVHDRVNNKSISGTGTENKRKKRGKKRRLGNGGATENSTSQKQMIKDQLQRALCILCRDTVAHKVKLSIEAVIAITIDNGEDVLVVSTNTYVSKRSSATLRSDNVFKSAIDERFGDSTDGNDDDDLFVGDVEEHDDVNVTVNEDDDSLLMGCSVDDEPVDTKPEITVPLMMTAGISSSEITGIVGESFNAEQTCCEELSAVETLRLLASKASASKRSAISAECCTDRSDCPSSPRKRFSETCEEIASDDVLSQTKTSSVSAFNRPFSVPMFAWSSKSAGPRVSNARRMSSPGTSASSDDPSSAEQPSTCFGDGGDTATTDDLVHLMLYACSECGVLVKDRSLYERHKRSHDGGVSASYRLATA